MKGMTKGGWGALLGTLLIAMISVSCGENPAGPDPDDCPGPNCPGNPDPGPGPGPGPNPPPTFFEGDMLVGAMNGNDFGNLGNFDGGVPGTFRWLTTDDRHKGEPAGRNSDGMRVWADTRGQCGDVSILMAHELTMEDFEELLRVQTTCVGNDGGDHNPVFSGNNEVLFQGQVEGAPGTRHTRIWRVQLNPREIFAYDLPQGMSISEITKLEGRRLFPSANEFQEHSLVGGEDGNSILFTMTDEKTKRIAVRMDLNTGVLTPLRTVGIDGFLWAQDEKGGKILWLGSGFLREAEDPTYDGFRLWTSNPDGSGMAPVIETGNPGIQAGEFCGSHICYLDWSRSLNTVYVAERDGTHVEQQQVPEANQFFDLEEVR